MRQVISIDGAQNGSSTTTTTNQNLAVSPEIDLRSDEVLRRMPNVQRRLFSSPGSGSLTSTTELDASWGASAVLNSSGRLISANVESLRLLRKSGKDIKSLGFVFTVNNWTEAALAFILLGAEEANDRGEIQYFAVSKEICPRTKTPHLQGCVFFKPTPSNKDGRWGIARVAESILQVHRHSCWPWIATAKGNMLSNQRYIGKDPIDDFLVQLGEPVGDTRVGQGTRTDIRSAIKFAQEANIKEIDIINAFPCVYAKYHRALIRCRQKAQYARRFDLRHAGITVHWYFGGTGTGKTEAAFAALEAQPLPFYEKAPGHRWFGGYDMEQIIWMDEFRDDWFSFAFLLRLFEPKARLFVEEKGTEIPLNANVFYVTSCESPMEMFYNAKGGRASSKRRASDKVEQLIRRILANGSIVEFKKVTNIGIINLEEPIFSRRSYDAADCTAAIARIARTVDGEFAQAPGFTLV